MPDRRTARLAGVLYLLTFVSIPTLSLYASAHTTPLRLDVDAVRLGALLEIVVALACLGTAVVLHPVLRRSHPTAALGFVAIRTTEAALILAGVAAMLALLTPPGAPTIGQTLVAQYDALFLVSQSLMPGISALLLGGMLYRTRLVPRPIPLIGLVGAPLHLTAVLLTAAGVLDRASPATLLAAAPIALWEFTLGLRLAGWGFDTPVPSRVAPAPQAVTAR